MKNRMIFYSSVESKSLFQTQRFYQVDIEILQRMGYDVILSNNVLDAFKFWKYDLAFAYFFRYSFFFSIIARLFGKKIYLTGGIDALERSYVGEKAYKIQKLFFKLCYIFATKCIIVSKTDLAHVEEIVGKNAKKLVYSEHTIETSAFNGGALEQKSSDFCTIGWMGNKGNVQRKGIDRAIYLFSLLKKFPQFSNSKFFLMGKRGEGTNYLESLIKLYELNDDVIITGEVSEETKIEILKKCQYYFQLSHYEGFGVACLEALIAGDVIIHSGKGGLANPIYNKHILVDINSDIEKQVDFIYNKMSTIDMKEIQKNSKECLVYYDNQRRLEDFEKIIGKCN